MNPAGAIIAVPFALLTVPALVGGILVPERRFSGRTHTQRRDLIGLVRAIRGHLTTGAPSSTTFREGVTTTDRTSRAFYGANPADQIELSVHGCPTPPHRRRSNPFTPMARRTVWSERPRYAVTTRGAPPRGDRTDVVEGVVDDIHR